MSRASIAVVLTLVSALPCASRAQIPADYTPSLQAVDLRCQVVSEDLRIGALSLAVTGGRAFQLPAAAENVRPIPRLTRQVLEVREDSLGLLDGSRVELDRFRLNGAGAVVLYLGERWTLSVRDDATQQDGREVAAIELTQYRAPEEGGTRSKFAGFCEQTTRSQDPLSADETRALLSGAGDRQAKILANSLDAAPPPAPMVGRTTEPRRSPPAERTPESVTLPLQSFRCTIVSDEAAGGELAFTVSGGRGYIEPDRYGGRTKIATTRRKMTVDRDTFGLFADKYPLEPRTLRGPFDLFQDSDGAKWLLTVDNQLIADGDNRDAVQVVRVSFRPPRDRRREDVQPRVARRYLGFCRQSSTRQSALSNDERREELWR